MNQLEYIASDGKFVVGKSFQSELWVYDIDIYLFSVKIAVVGFTNKNLNGAIFFQDICYEHDKYNLDSEDIIPDNLIIPIIDFFVISTYILRLLYFF